MDYHDKVVLVTGGAKGIGKAISNEYLVLSATVIIADTDAQSGEFAVREWCRAGYEFEKYWNCL
ncbi:MAG: SDR family NAD(P)-dependent oxidoreductase [Negativicutes bacterium]